MRFVALLLSSLPALAQASRYADDVYSDESSGYRGAGQWWEYALFLPLFWACVVGIYLALCKAGRYKHWVALAFAVGTYLLIGIAGPFYVVLALAVAFLHDK